MKNLIIAFALLVSVLGVSCKKGNEPKPQCPAATVSNIDVEYRINCASGNASADYIAPNAAGKLEMTHTEISRTSQSISFSCPTGNLLSVSATNTMPSHNVVQVQIFVNGTMVAESSSTDPSQKAIAQGNF